MRKEQEELTTYIANLSHTKAEEFLTELEEVADLELRENAPFS